MLKTASITRTIDTRFDPPACARYSILMTVAGTDGNGTFSISQRYTRQLARQYAHMVNLEIGRRGHTFIEALPGLKLAVDSVVVLTPEGLIA